MTQPASMPEAATSSRLVVRDIAKTFSGIRALAGVSFDLRPGEVHAIVGENGAGKSTLIKVIAGAYAPDAGTIEIDGVPHGALTPAQARRLGIGIVYQEFNLLPELSAAENIFLGAQPLGAFGLIDPGQRRRGALAILERLGAHVDPDRPVRFLTVGEQQVVEIAKALATNARILIMDEPSAVLPSHDLDRLFGVIRALRAEGHSVIYISHRLDEIFEIADRVTVLKDGQSMGTKRVADTNRAELVRSMVGRSLQEQYPADRARPGEEVLQVRGLSADNVVWDVSFDLRAGEVLGLAGLGGSGRTTVARALVGLARITAGTVFYRGQPVPRDPGAAAQAGIVLIPEDRQAHGLVLGHSIRFNVSLPSLPQLERFRLLLGRRERTAVHTAISDLQIRPALPDLVVENLSGGNQQKVVIGKWLLTEPKVVIFDEPTRGIDVGAKAEIYNRIRLLTRRGVAVLMASSELPELLGMSDRILVFHEGRVAGELSRAEATEEAIMHLATGSTAAVG